MTEIRTALQGIEQQIHARPDALERVFEGARRRRREQRIAAGARALAIGAAVLVAVAIAAPLVPRPVSTSAAPIGPANVARLATVWTRSLAGAGSSAPVVADGMVYVAADDGKLYALDASTGAIDWVGASQAGAPTSPVVADGAVLLQVGGRLFAFDTRCGSGGSACQPSWTAETGGGKVASPVVVDGVAYVVAAPGGLSAFPATCQPAGVCAPIWVAPDLSTHNAQIPAVGDGVVWDSSSHALSAFAIGCGTSGAPCAPIVDRIAPDGAELLSGAAIADGILYVGGSDGRLFVLDTACATGGSCAFRSIGKTDGSIIDTPVVAGGQVFVGSNDGRAYAFSTSCPALDAPCAPRWFGTVGGPMSQPPLVVGGVVYATSTDGKLYAFPATCGVTGGECQPLLSRTIGGLPPTPAMWGDRVLFTIGADGTLEASTVDGTGV